jgi:WD40 repeat protein
LEGLITPDGRSALTAKSELPFRLRDLATGKDLGEPSSACIWRRGATPSWSPDGRLFAVAHGATVELWRGDLRRRLRDLKVTSGMVENFLAFSRDGKLVIGLAGERLHVWETDTGRLRGILLLGEQNNGLTIAADGHYTGDDNVERGIVVVVQKDDGTQEMLEPADFEQKYGRKNDPDKVHLLRPLPPPLYPQPGEPLGSLALVREPDELPGVNSWTVETVNGRGGTHAVAYRPGGKLLATGGDDGTIRIWDVADGKLVRMLVGDPVQTLSWSKDGKVLAAASYDVGAASLWEVDTGRLLHRIAEARQVAWSPAGNTLAVADRPFVRLWDAAEKRDIGARHFGDGVQALAWSPDGKTLAVGLQDKTARLWDVASDKETARLEDHPGPYITGLPGRRTANGW